MSLINIYSEDSKYLFRGKRKVKNWLLHLCENKGFSIEEVNIIFCSDEYLFSINEKYLNHSYYTDVITFDNSENRTLSGEIYISVDRIKENALKYRIPVFEEFLRVISHGFFHLMNYNDADAEERQIMKQEEDTAILFFYSLNSNVPRGTSKKHV